MRYAPALLLMMIIGLALLLFLRDLEISRNEGYVLLVLYLTGVSYFVATFM